jgi:large subunit ribosomal protein L15e
MVAYKYISKAWRNPRKSYVRDMMRRVAERWRKEPAIIRVEAPTRLDRARRFGYKAKQGFAVVRVRLRKGGARKIRPVSGRRPRALGVTKFTRGKSLKKIAQDRAAKKFPNMLPLNSYWTWEDGKHKWFEVVMVDPNHPSVRNDRSITLPAKI